ncbi:MAG: collagen-like triple helix repeat-containing protein [Candidatus Microsaccharimonas sp.]
MSRLPNPGQDDGTWGEILNDYLGQSHASDGTLKAGSVGPAQLQDGSIATQKLAPGVQVLLAKADASLATATAHATFIKTVNGHTSDEDGDVIVSGEQGPKGDKGDKGDAGEQGIQGIPGEPGTDGQDGASITVTFVSAADWPPPSDPDPLHWYVKVP